MMTTLQQFIPYWGDDEIDAVAGILRDSDYLNEHNTVREFERRFAQSVGAKHCIAVTSGTVALYCAINAVYGNRKKKKITVPTHDGIFAFNALLASGTLPVVVDVDSRGLIDPHTHENDYIAVHANGRRVNSAAPIEDCAQAITHHAPGKVSTYSFASTKHITTAGQGGAVCCDDDETFSTLARLKDHGRNDRQMLKPMSDNYDSWGMNFKLTEVQAAFGLVQLNGLKGRMTRLGEICRIYREILGDAVTFDSEEPKWYVDVFTPHAKQIHQDLKIKGIHCRPYPRPLHTQTVALGYLGSTKFPNGERRRRTGLYLPSTTNLADDDVVRVAQEVRQAAVNMLR